MPRTQFKNEVTFVEHPDPSYGYNYPAPGQRALNVFAGPPDTNTLQSHINQRNVDGWKLTSVQVVNHVAWLCIWEKLEIVG